MDLILNVAHPISMEFWLIEIFLSTVFFFNVLKDMNQKPQLLSMCNNFLMLEVVTPLHPTIRHAQSKNGRSDFVLFVNCGPLIVGGFHNPGSSPSLLLIMAHWCSDFIEGCDNYKKRTSTPVKKEKNPNL